MIRYAAGRVVAIVPVLFGVSIVVFLLIRLIPGNPAISILGERATPELVERVRNQLGLDLPIWRQYLHFLGNVSRGDFGASYFYHQEVSTLTLERIPITLALIAYATAIALVIAVPFATLAAARREGPVDHAIRLVFTGTIGIPTFWMGIILALLLSVKLRLLPLGGVGVNRLDTLWHLTLPALTIALHISPIFVRALRSSLIEVMNSDYVTTGVAMGLRPITLLVSYLLRNGLTPFISVLGLNVGWLIGGTIIIEQVFGVPGVGSLLITSILTRDYSIIQFVALVLAVLVILVNLLTDLAYAALDPRVSFRA
ncbi:MAG: ABC transporter permease [Candidatus Rokuibacteriota bacterium]|nr:MAG: ABC transporter permease [Candidatus Rokubacteria bacterium]